MGLLNLKRVRDYQVEEWLFDNIKELSEYQKEWIKNEEMVRFSPFEFYERRKRVNNVFIRFTIFFCLFTWVLLVCGLPFNFLITGNWGYKSLNWFSKWSSACGLDL